MQAAFLWRLHGSRPRRLTRPPNLAATLMKQSPYAETGIVGFTLYSLGKFRYMRNIGDFFCSPPGRYQAENLVASHV